MKLLLPSHIFSLLILIAGVLLLNACMLKPLSISQENTIESKSMETRTGYVKADGAELYYQDTGSGTAIVFAHGSAGNSDSWEQQVPDLVAAGYRVIRFDIRSYGRSRAEPGMHASASVASDIEHIRQALNLGKIVVVGQAHGGEGALEYGLDFPSKTLGIISASSYRAAEGEPAFVELRDTLAPPEKIARSTGVEMRLTDSYRQSNPEGVARFMEIDEENKTRSALLKTDLNQVISSSKLRKSVQSTRLPIDYKRLSTMKVPVLILSGELDTITSSPLMEALAQQIPNARHEIVADAGRYAFWEKPNNYNTIVLRFLNDISDTP